MGVQIKDNTPKIKSDMNQRASLFVRFMAEEIVDDSEKHTPKKMGNLRQDILRQVLGLKGKIIWGKGYAAIQETKQFRNYTTPGTGPHFAENAVKGSRGKVSDVARKAGLI